MNDIIICAAILAAYGAAFLTGRVSRGILASGQDTPAFRANAIDGLRGVLALGVMVHHFAISNTVLHGGIWQAPPEHYLNNIGKMAVAFFFMITGYLFFPTIANGFKSTDWVGFYIRRFFRIVPLMWFVLIIVIVIAFILSTSRAPSLGIAVAIGRWAVFAGMPDIFGYPNTKYIIAGVAWSLTFECLYYASILPASLLASRLNMKLAVIACAAFGALVLAVIQLFPGVIPYKVGEVITYLTLFAFGMTARVLTENSKIVRYFSDKRVGVLLIVAQLVCLFVSSSPFGAIQAVIACALLIAIAVNNPAVKILSTPTAVALGEASYSIYLLHGIFLFGYFHTAAHLLYSAQWIWLSLPVMAAIVCAASMVSHKFLEVPFMALGKRLAGRQAVDRQTAKQATPV